MNYEEFLNDLKNIKGKEKQVDYLFNFLLENLEYDYLYLEIVGLMKLQKEINIDFSELYDEELVDETLKKFAKHTEVSNCAVRYFKDREYENMKPGLCTDSPIFENGILKKGVCAQFAAFVKKVCDELEIECVVQRGTTPFGHDWNKIKIENQWLNYDITYAIFSKDKYKNWHKKSNPKDWLGITDEELLALHPERNIGESINTLN